MLKQWRNVCILSPTGSSCLHQYAEEWRPKERKVYPIPRGKSLWRHDMDLTLFEGNPTVTGGFPSQRASNVELEVCCCQFNQAFAQTVELSIVLDAMTLLRRHYDIEDSLFSAVQYRTWKSWDHVNRISKYSVHVIQLFPKYYNQLKIFPRYWIHRAHESGRWTLLGPLLLTWFNFNPSMDKQLHPL